MIRFVDIRGAETGYNFAWWNTVYDLFETHGGNQAWDSFEDFQNSYEGDGIGRYGRLAQPWTFKLTE